MSKNNNDILDNFFNFIKKEISPSIKKDFTWLSKIINEDLENLTKEKNNQRKKKNKSNK